MASTPIFGFEVDSSPSVGHDVLPQLFKLASDVETELAAIIPFTNMVTDYAADPTGATDSSSALQDALNDGCKCIYFPPTLADGVTRAQYLFDPAARGHAGGFDMATATGDDVEIFSYGAKLILPATTTVTANIAFIKLTLGNKQKIHGFQVDGTTTASGSGSVGGFAVGNGAYGAEVYGNYFTNFNNSAPGGGAGSGLITTYNGGDVYPYPSYQATLGTTIAAGTRTVTPSSMRGIYPGRYLLVDNIVTPAAEERVVVTDVTATTFTAVFANNHLSTADVSFRDGYWQAANIHDNFFYYNLSATPLVINSRGNKIVNNTSVQSGKTGLMHGIYMQGGDNYIAGNYFEGVYGYTFHQYPADASHDTTGNIWQGNWSVDPVTQHGVVVVLTSTTNPLFPAGTSMGRNVTFRGNHFIKRSANVTTIPTAGLAIDGPAIVEGNFFEDTTSANTYNGGSNTGIGNEWLRVGPHSIVSSNQFLSFASLTTNVASSFILGTYSGGNSNGVVVTNNTFYRARASVAISLPGATCVAANNTFDTITGDANAATFPLIEVGTYTNVSGNVSRSGNQKMLTLANLAQTGNTSLGNTSDSGGAFTYVRGLLYGEGAALTVAGNAVAPTHEIHKVADTGGLIKNITLPLNFTDGTIIFIAGSTPFTMDATGNLFSALTPSVGDVVGCVYSPSDSKWYCKIGGGGGGGSQAEILKFASLRG